MAAVAASPSALPHRAPIVALALIGCAIALYLALYQLGVTASIWDPLFGRGSEAVVDSPLSRALPLPDAVVGALAYALDAVLGALGDEGRWRTTPWLVLLHGLVLLGLVLAGILLVLAQALLLHTGCLLCLCSAAVSFASGWLAHGEVWAAVQHLRTKEDCA